MDSSRTSGGSVVTELLLCMRKGSSLPGKTICKSSDRLVGCGRISQVSISLAREILTSIIGYWVKKVGESRYSGPVRVVTDA